MIDKVSLQSWIERCLHMAEEGGEPARKSSTDKRRDRGREWEPCSVCGARADIGIYTAAGLAAYYCAKHAPPDRS